MRVNRFLTKWVMASGFLFAAGLCYATDVAYSGTFVGTEGQATYTGQTATSTYTRDMNTSGDRVSMQIVASTSSFASVTFSSHNYIINTPTITVTNSFTTGLQVLFSTGTMTPISGLTLGTTYFISVIRPNTFGIGTSFKLSSTYANAVAGTGIVLASTNPVANVYTLAPLAISGAGVITPQWSDDNSTYFTAATGNYNASVTPVTISGATQTALIDFGPTQHRYLRVKVIPPLTGGINYTVTTNERYSATH